MGTYSVFDGGSRGCEIFAIWAFVNLAEAFKVGEKALFNFFIHGTGEKNLHIMKIFDHLHAESAVKVFANFLQMPFSSLQIGKNVQKIVKSQILHDLCKICLHANVQFFLHIFA